MGSNMSLGTNLPSLKFTDKEAYYLYSRVLQHNTNYQKHLSNLNSELARTQRSLDQIQRLPISNSETNLAKNRLTERQITLLKQIEYVNIRLNELDSHLEFIVNNNPHVVFDIYLIQNSFILSPKSPSKFPSIRTPLIDRDSNLRLNTSLNLAIPVNFSRQ